MGTQHTVVHRKNVLDLFIVKKHSECLKFVDIHLTHFDHNKLLNELDKKSMNT